MTDLLSRRWSKNKWKTRLTRLRTPKPSNSPWKFFSMARKQTKKILLMRSFKINKLSKSRRTKMQLNLRTKARRTQLRILTSTTLMKDMLRAKLLLRMLPSSRSRVTRRLFLRSLFSHPKSLTSLISVVQNLLSKLSKRLKSQNLRHKKSRMLSKRASKSKRRTIRPLMLPKTFSRLRLCQKLRRLLLKRMSLPTRQRMLPHI